MSPRLYGWKIPIYLLIKLGIGYYIDISHGEILLGDYISSFGISTLDSAGFPVDGEDLRGGGYPETSIYFQIGGFSSAWRLFLCKEHWPVIRVFHEFGNHVESLRNLPPQDLLYIEGCLGPDTDGLSEDYCNLRF